ncbi:hypothetical protein SLEP1_g14410 [Rubroshorea leprosula]|uniref:Uncharacterized protein n=1 Tax=Rubroshorea leprosula TaxID=152421 RepID=A0AAV5IVH9_9ROSI|nr:hypothetical protein SLEP1_g14410 [Rubroshorea leprosula]
MGHLGNATACPKVPQEVREELWNYYNEKKSQKSTGSSGSFQTFNYLEDCEIGDDDLDEVELVEFNASCKRLLTAKSGVGMQELARYGVTRFATTYLTLERVHKQKINLRKMFTSNEWMKSKFYKEVKGRRVTDVVLMPSFWNETVYALKVMGPLVGVHHLLDNEKKLAMGYIYELMDRTKEAIQKAFDGNEEKYKHVFSLIDNKWENQLHHPLHAAGHFLNS